MSRSRTPWAILISFCVAILLDYSVVSGQHPAQSNHRVLKWGGPGFDRAKIEGETRFAAELGEIDKTTGKAALKILVDSQETWEDLDKLSLTSEDGKVSVRTTRIGKLQRHVSAPWVCHFLADDIKQLPEVGFIVGWNSNGKQVLSESTDFRSIKAMVATSH
jgi:hypothetical protein